MKPVSPAESSTPAEIQPVQSLGRVLDVLQLFSSRGPELSLSEIADLLEWSPPTAHRATATLVERAFLARDPSTKRFRLGPAVTRLVAPLLAGLELPELARPYLQALAEGTGETVNLATLDGSEVLYLASYPGSFRVRVDATPGLRLPAHCSALGKCLLAQLEPEDARRRLGAEPYPPRTAATARSWADLAPRLAAARAEGYALSVGEYEDGLLSCAVPLEPSDRVVAAINVAAPATRTTPEALVERMIPRLQATAATIRAAQAVRERES